MIYFSLLFSLFCVFQFFSFSLFNFLFFYSQTFRLRVLLSFCLILSQFQRGIAYGSVVYKNSVYIRKENLRKSYNSSVNKRLRIQ